MRVGIITYHFAENYGSAFQSYALSAYLILLMGLMHFFLIMLLTDSK